MTRFSLPDRPPGPRPRARTLVRIDLYNAYARLGVSPLLTTEEIKSVILQKRKEQMHDRRAKATQAFGKEEEEITKLQAIEDEIGTPAARARYDETFPQNELLTVQPAPADRWFDARHRAAAVTRWLVEALGRDALLPSPEATAFWLPTGLPPDVAAFLAGFAAAAAALPTVSEIDRLPPPAPPTEVPPHG